MIVPTLPFYVICSSNDDNEGQYFLGRVCLMRPIVVANATSSPLLVVEDSRGKASGWS